MNEDAITRVMNREQKFVDHVGSSMSRQLHRSKDVVLAFVNRHPYIAVFAFLAGISIILYLPALTAYFISDDFSQVSFLYFNIADLLHGQRWDQWFLGVLDGYLYFRPATYALTLVDFLAWNRNPFGYHLTNFILHVSSSFLVFLIALQWTRRRSTAIAAATLFAVLPSHAGAVSWIAAITDVLCGFLYLMSTLFFVLYRRKEEVPLYVYSLGAFVLALAAKEVAILLPAGILLYDVLFNFSKPFRIWDWVKRHAPFWIILGIYLTFRFMGPGAFGYRGTQLSSQYIWNWINGTLVQMVDPLPSGMSAEGQWIILGILLVILFLYRSRPVVMLGLAWIPLTYLPTINSITGTSDRSFYIPSLGVCVVLASILMWPIEKPREWLKALGFAALIFLSIWYGLVLLKRNQVFNQAGQVAEAIPQNVKALHPTLPPGARLVFVGVPDNISEGPLIYLSGFQASLAMTYREKALQVFKFDRFPIRFDDLGRTFFFEVDHRRVTERADLMAALEKRRECETASFPTIFWDFSKDTQGWEPWNQLSGFAVRDGILNAQSDGKDPYIVSPLIDIPSIAIGDIAITMRVSAKADMKGRVYWLGASQRDFSPALQVPFAITADGEYHTYHVDISQSDQLLLDDHILRLRLDPADDKAKIGIKAIQVYSHCSELQGEYCSCSQ